MRASRCVRDAGRVIGADQGLTAAEALRLFTVNGARLTFDAHWKGPLKPGFAADIAVLSADPTALPAAQLKKLACRLTVVGGRIVHEDLNRRA